jgi:hypothetical protein
MTNKSNKTLPESKSSPAVEGWDEKHLFGSLFLARKGRYVYMENLASPEEHRLAMQELKSKMGEYKDSIEKQVLELEEILKKYPPIEIIGNMVFRNAILDFDQYKEYETKENLVYAEYVALLYLCGNIDEYPQIAEPVLPHVVEDIQERVKNLFISQVFYLGFKNVDPDNLAPDTLEEIRFKTLLKSFFIGETAYHHHRIGMIKEIFAPVSEEINAVFGFTVDDVLKIADGVQNLMSRKFSVRKEKALAFAKDLLKATKIYRLKKRFVSDYSQEMLVELGKLLPSEARQKVFNISTAWVFASLDEVMSFTIEELVAETHLSKNVVEKYLVLFSLRVGEVDSNYYRYPSPTHPLRTKPIIRIDNKFFCPIPASIYTDLHLGLEEYLNPDNRNALNREKEVWNKYEQSRRVYLEKKSVEYLSKCLKYSEYFNNLEYAIVENGVETTAELDGLLLLDDVLFIVEAKAGTFSLPARRGAPSIVEDMEELVGNAYGQSKRAKRYILESDKPVFRLSDGTKVTIPKDKIKKIFLVNVSLENLDSVIVNFYKLKDLGLVSGTDFPWSVCITDLRIISEIVETSCEFVHYLLSRHRINELAFVEAHDEIDLFGRYLLEGLEFDEFNPPKDKEGSVTLGSYTTIFDDYYYSILGLREKRASRPRQPMPELFRQFVEELEAVHQHGYLHAACALLDLRRGDRDKFIKGFKEIKRRTIHDRRAHNITSISPNGKSGVTCVALPSERFGELQAVLTNYCVDKKQELDLNYMVGFGTIANSKKLISYLLLLESPSGFTPPTTSPPPSAN